jgi:hypothetical protein
MANSVFWDGGAYDIHENNRRRALVFLDPVFPDPKLISRLMDAERQIRAEYAERKMKRAAEDVEAFKTGRKPRTARVRVTLNPPTGETSTKRDFVDDDM